MSYNHSAAGGMNRVLAGAAVALLWSAGSALAQPGTVLSHQKISSTQGGGPLLGNGDAFGHSATSLGDLDGDGVGDLAVGAWRDDDGGFNRGAVWILFLNPDGTVKSGQTQKISDTQGGFTGILDNVDLFGISVASLGDLDGAGPSVLALAVGAPGDDDGGFNHGAVWILFLNPNGTVNSHQKISDTAGGFTGILDNMDNFGNSAASLGDLDGDGVGDLAVGAWRDDDGGLAALDRGAVWILFLNANGTVKSHQKISDTQGGFTGILANGDAFGLSVGSLGDLDGDGVGDLAVGAAGVDELSLRGAAWILFLNTNGTVKSHQKISNTEGGGPPLDVGDRFGTSVGSLGDLDGDGVGDLAVGAFHDDDGGFHRGAVWVLFLNTDGMVNSHQKISDTQGGFTGTLDNNDQFGLAAASLGDLDGDGLGDLAVGAQFDDDGGGGRGAVWILFLDGVLTLDLDIKPGSCPNSFNRNSHGVLPVALVGTDTFDVAQVDISSIQVSRADGVGGSVTPHEGPPGPHSTFEDVATPFDGQLCNCHELEGDGITDLSMKFKTDDVVAALQLNDLLAGDLVELVVEGALLDGTPFSASDCIRLVPPGTGGGLLAVGSNLPGAWIDLSPLDLQLDGGGFANFERTYPQTTVVTLTAPQMHHGWRFVGWRIGLAGSFHGGGLQPGPSIDLTILDDVHRIEAIYRPPLLHDLHEH
ncbi:MAG: FG-GAP repeat protein [Planctomycetes bacterium]|nr:FG-GAP repeat protein [Planctomycetota bacterium]